MLGYVCLPWVCHSFFLTQLFADPVADGGGVRGLSSLYILRSIMEMVNKERKKVSKDKIEPCDLFDLICGTSTGG
jgi:patatin-like phospholipase/acyl hydrolase